MYQPELTINLKAIADNFLVIKQYTKAKVSAVLKANAYGLGAKVIANKLYEVGCRDFWVAYLNEALALRQVLSQDCNIYVLQGFNPNEIDILKQYKLTQVINSVEEFNLACNHNLDLVLFVETGLGRIGIREIDDILPKLRNENINYVISHLACADFNQDDYNRQQKEKFDSILSKIRTVIPVKASLVASNGIFLDYHYDMVRVGGFLYGNQPSNSNSLNTKCVVKLQATVLQKYTAKPNESIGYSRTFICNKDTKIAVLSIGYADGIFRSLSNKGFVWFCNNTSNNITSNSITNNTVASNSITRYCAPIIGNISMDLLACDVTNVPDELSNIGCQATLLDDIYTINRMAADANSGVSEILTSINTARLQVHYIN